MQYFLLLTTKTIVANVVLAYGSREQFLNMETQSKHCVSKKTYNQIWLKRGKIGKSYSRFDNNQSSHFETSPRALKVDQSTLDTKAKHEVYYFTYDHVYSKYMALVTT